MMWPSVAEERMGVVADRLKVPVAKEWRRHSIPLTVTFFVLTCIGVAAFAVFLNLIHAPYGVMTLVVSVAIAELLINFYKFQRTGVESALWIAGPVAFIVSLPSQGKPEAVLVFAAAALIAGLRVRNPLFIAAAAALVDVYVDKKIGSVAGTIAVGLGIAALAAIALMREWQRPSTEWAFDALVLVMPLVTYLIVEKRGFVFVLIGIAMLAVGIVMRHRVLLWAATIAIGTGAFHIAKQFAYPDEAKLIAAGALLVAIAVLLARRLRRNQLGFTTTKVEDRLEALQMLGAIHASATPAVAPEKPGFQSGGGGFGGGGATGSV